MAEVYDDIFEAVRHILQNHPLLDLKDRYGQGKLQRNVSFEAMTMPNGKTVMLPRDGSLLQFYRGERKLYPSSCPHIYRNADEDTILIRRLKIIDFSLIARTFPQVYYAERMGVDVDMLALAQHYELPTDMMDFTSDISVAAFFATTYFDKQANCYVPMSSGEGRISSYMFIPDTDFFEHGNSSFRFVGLQPFERPGRQCAFGVQMAQGQTYESLNMGFTVRFHHRKYQNQKILDLFGNQKYNDLFPEELIADAADKIKNENKVTDAAIQQNVSELEQKIAVVRKKHFGSKEMKSSSIGSNHPRRAKVLTELLQLDFQIIILIADKRSFYENSPLRDYKKTFVKFLHQKLYDSMYCAYPKLKIVEDEFGSSEFQQGYRKYVCEHRPAENLFNEYDFDYIDSKQGNLVQIADIVAGSVMQHITDPAAPDVLKIFKSRIVDIVNFPDTFKPYNIEVEGNSEFDNSIYQLAYKCATDYVERNKDTDNEEIRLRVLFLRILLYNVQICNSTQFVYSGELVQHLSQISDRKVTKDYLYRRIIAPLRDEGVIIASSVHGYKIPTSVEDIHTYINQTVTVVGPMLSRIGKCRELIQKQTDRKLDILADASLSGYQRYFGDY